MQGEAISNFGLILSYILLGAALLAALFVAVKGLTTNPKGAKVSLIFIVGFVLVFAISYGMADNEVLDAYKKFDITPSMSKFIGALINTMWISLILAGVSFVYAQIASFLK